MFGPALEAVRGEVSGACALESVQALSRFHRVQASPGYDQAAAWLAERLVAAGLRPEVERIAADGRTHILGQLMPEGWVCERATAALLDGGRREPLCDYEEECLSLVLRSDPARGRFPLVAVEGGGRAEHYAGLDVRGAVVLTSAPVQRALELAVHERGAAGLLVDGRRLMPPVRGPADDTDSLAYTSFWWEAAQPGGWGFVVSPRTGERLRERLRQRASLEIEVEIESRRFPTTIPLVSAAIPGAGEDEVLILAHLCHPRPSANDNASGAAAALESARALAALRARGALGDWRRGARFLWMPEFTGTAAWFGREAARAGRTVAALNLDMVGESQERCGSTLLLEHPPCFAASFAEELLGRVRARAQDWVTDYSGPGHYSLTRMAEVPYAGGSDHAVLTDPAVGVPCPQLIQWPDRYYHSSLDTPDRCDPGSLALASRCAAAYAAFLAAAGPREQAWLLEAVARGARRRLLVALDAEERPRATEREHLRGALAIESLTRLGVQAEAIRRARQAYEEFALREAFEVSAAPPAAAAGTARSERVPVRRERGPLACFRHLAAGWSALDQAAREAWRGTETRHPEPLFDLAWFACNGSRTLRDIARLLWIETGRHEPEGVEALFEWTARLGQSGWRGR